MFNSIFLKLFENELKIIEQEKIEYNNKLNNCCQKIKEILINKKDIIKDEIEYTQLLIENI